MISVVANIPIYAVYNLIYKDDILSDTYGTILVKCLEKAGTYTVSEMYRMLGPDVYTALQSEVLSISSLSRYNQWSLRFPESYTLPSDTIQAVTKSIDARLYDFVKFIASTPSDQNMFETYNYVSAAYYMFRHNTADILTSDTFDDSKLHLLPLLLEHTPNITPNMSLFNFVYLLHLLYLTGPQFGFRSWLVSDFSYDPSSITTEFSNYIASHYDQVATLVAPALLTSVLSTYAAYEPLINRTVEAIVATADDLKSQWNTFASGTITNLYNLHVLSYLYNVIALRTTMGMLLNISIALPSTDEWEQQLYLSFGSFANHMAGYNRQHRLLLLASRNNILRAVHLLYLVSDYFVHLFSNTVDIVQAMFNITDVMNVLGTVSSDELANYLNSNLKDTLLGAISGASLPLRVALSNLIYQFCNSDAFGDYLVNSLYPRLEQYLEDLYFVDLNTRNLYRNIDVARFLFYCAFTALILDNQIFPNVENELLTQLHDEVSSSFSYNTTPAIIESLKKTIVNVQINKIVGLLNHLIWLTIVYYFKIKAIETRFKV